MTVKRQDSETFKTSKENIWTILDEILDDGQKAYSYINTRIIQHDDTIHTTIEHDYSPFTLSTQLKITIQDKGDSTVVTAYTTSQWFIIGDIFNYYRKYIRDLFRSIEIKIKRQA
ncbi:hypothetical protein [Neptuniibacter sp.]|uniref:hypothetical protein n=1 Tax=Neptuniibacter sp. TaxID=1962643 RepID=UPI00262C9A40|nr:hypothetical protein [Neptuniibacter sp.]MCP4598644.1 hypothetical protein [Neptuniibacter sp.]